MFGQNLFGRRLYAQGAVKSEYIPSEDFAFNAYGLQNPTQYGIHITNYDIETPRRDFGTADVPSGHGLIYLKDYYRQNPVKFNGWVSAPNKQALDSKIHEMLRNIQGRGGTLYIKDEGNYKTLTTTLKTAQFENEHYSTVKKKFMVEFEGVDSFWKDKDYSSIAYSAQTTLSLNGQMNNLGSVEAEPVIIMIFDTATGVTGVGFQNVSTGEEVTITETINNGDVLIFDKEKGTVELNNTELEFDGRIPELRVGINSITITVTGSSALYDVTAKHKNQYLTP